MNTNDLQQLAQQIAAMNPQSAYARHWPAIVLAASWLVREANVWWPGIKAIWPFVTKNGGILGLVKRFFVGESRVNQPAPPAQPQQYAQQL